MVDGSFRSPIRSFSLNLKGKKINSNKFKNNAITVIIMLTCGAKGYYSHFAAPDAQSFCIAIHIIMQTAKCNK